MQKKLPKRLLRSFILNKLMVLVTKNIHYLDTGEARILPKRKHGKSIRNDAVPILSRLRRVKIIFKVDNLPVM